MITVFGLGFTGITTSLYFSERKNIKVFGIDIDSEKKEKINKSTLPFYEPKLEKILTNNLNKNFFVTNKIKESINKSEYIFITVGTSMKKNGSANLSSVLKVINTIIKRIDTSVFRTIVIKSSIPPTVTEKIILPFIEEKGLKIGKDIGLCVNPEFLREGKCYEEIKKANRIIIGCNDEKSKEKMNLLYRERDTSIFNVNYNTAEFSKYLSNSFLANLISFSNEMSIIADALGDINVKEAFEILKEDNRWNRCEMRNYVHPIGKYGGYCLPKDINALLYVSKKNGFNSKMLRDTICMNRNLEEYFVKRIIKEAENNKKIGILGLSFKPDSDDVRNTSSYYIIKKLNQNNYNSILAYDPISINNFKQAYKDINVEYIEKYEEIIEKSDVLVIVTIWDEFKDIKKITNKKVIDFTHKI